MGERKALAVIGILLLTFIVGVSSAAIGALGASSANNGGLISPAGIGNTVFTVQGYSNGSNANWAAETYNGYGTHTLTVTTANGVNTTHVYVLSDNNAYNALNLLKHGDIYVNLNVSTPSTYHLTAVYLYAAEYVNSSSTSAFADKGVKEVTQNITMYSASTNNLKLDTELSVNDLMNSFNLNKTYIQIGIVGYGNFSASKITMTYEHPFSLNIFTTIAGAAMVASLIAVYFVYQSIPRRYQ